MIEAFIAIIILLIISNPWSWRHILKKRAIKKELNEKLQNYPDKQRIIQTTQFLIKLYHTVDAANISQQNRHELNLQEDAYIYGEIDFLTFFLTLDKIHPKPTDKFYDLGSGSGKAVFAAALYFDLSFVCGIERLPGLVKLANEQLIKSNSYLKNSNVHFINTDLFNYDFSDADIVFITATCFSYPAWEKLIDRLSLLRTGSRIIVTSKKIEHPNFKLIDQTIELMGWGLSQINIYEKI